MSDTCASREEFAVECFALRGERLCNVQMSQAHQCGILPIRPPVFKQQELESPVQSNNNIIGLLAREADIDKDRMLKTKGAR